jgi:hypothetical protein
LLWEESLNSDGKQYQRNEQLQRNDFTCTHVLFQCVTKAWSAVWW